MATERTLAEIKAYIIESIDLWGKKGSEKRIIDLFKWAEKWRVRDENDEIASNIKLLESNIRKLTSTIDDNKKLGISTDVLHDTVLQMYDMLNDLQMKYIPPPKRTRKPKK